MLQLNESDLQNPEELGKKLMQLAEIIIRKHFYASYKDKDDLISVGVLKALSLIDEGNWDRSKGSFLNYIYSGMRNDIHNYLYHDNKFFSMSKETVRDTGADDTYFAEGDCPIDYELIHSICKSFMIPFGEGIEDAVISKLQDIGYIITNRPTVPMFKITGDVVKAQYDNTIDESDIVGRLIGLILWEKKERDAVT